jgi:hypothetical protein
MRVFDSARTGRTARVGVSVPSRERFVLDTDDIGVGESWLSWLRFGSGWQLFGFGCDAPCRVRVWASLDGFEADEDRAIGVDPPDGPGLLFEFVADDVLQFADLSPTVTGWSVRDDGRVPVEVTRLHGSGSLTVWFDYVPLVG